MRHESLKSDATSSKYLSHQARNLQTDWVARITVWYKFPHARLQQARACMRRARHMHAGMQCLEEEEKFPYIPELAPRLDAPGASTPRAYGALRASYVFELYQKMWSKCGVPAKP